MAAISDLKEAGYYQAQDSKAASTLHGDRPESKLASTWASFFETCYYAYRGHVYDRVPTSASTSDSSARSCRRRYVVFYNDLAMQVVLRQVGKSYTFELSEAEEATKLDSTRRCVKTFGYYYDEMVTKYRRAGITKVLGYNWAIAWFRQYCKPVPKDTAGETEARRGLRLPKGARDASLTFYSPARVMNDTIMT